MDGVFLTSEWRVYDLGWRVYDLGWRVYDLGWRVYDLGWRVGTPTGSRELNLLPKEPIESFWGGLWLGIQPFLCFIPESRRVV